MVIITTIVIPLILFLGMKLSKYLKVKTKEENTKEYILEIKEIVEDTVRSVYQTYVEKLKIEGKFDQQAKLTAFIQAKNIALSLFSKEILNFIEEEFDDVDSYLINKIESTINQIKQKKSHHNDVIFFK